MFKKIFLSLLILMMSSAAYAEITTLSSAINKAGRQRMLTQRMVKAYSMVGIGVQADTAQQQLHSAIKLFDTQLAELRAFAPSEKIRASLDKVDALWQPFKVTLQKPNSRTNVELLLLTNDDLLRAAHRVVLQLEDESGTSFGRLVNISGRQRMLSQRMAKFYMLRAWGFTSAEILSEAERAKNEFKGALAELISAPENTPALSKKLLEAQKQWNLLEHGLERNSTKLIPLIVAMTSEKVLVKMNEITGMYEVLSSR
jgi:hypothetical protein